uniref:Menaquinone biosynthesis protein n=1 Tax=Cyanidium sp. THAL103 TaxID=3027999 RepID=A0A9Y1MYI8_9RHOD|nr:menaquinone biosynthesis protein [Cyanidium sp. THAL103]
MEKLKFIFLASRPKTLIISVSVFILSNSLSYYYKCIRWNEEYNLTLLLFTICLLFILIQILANYCNDYFDHINAVDLKERLGPTRLTNPKTLNLIKFTINLNIILIICISYFLLNFFQINVFFFQINILISLLFSFIYTGGSNPFGYKGLGEILVFISFGLLPMLIISSVYNYQFVSYFYSILLIIFSGFLSACVLITNNIRDQNTDAKSNKYSLTVLFGKNFTQIKYIILIMTGSLAPYIFILTRFNKNLLDLIILFVLFIKLKNLIKKNFTIMNLSEYNLLLVNTSSYLLLNSLYISILLIYNSK